MAGGGDSYLDLLPSHELHLTLLPQGELILDHFGASGDGELEVLPILHNFRHPLDILSLLDDVIRHPWRESIEGLEVPKSGSGASLVAQSVKNLPAMQETQVRSLGWEDRLEKEMVTHPSILVWRVPWTEEPGGLQSMGVERVGHD